MMHRRAVQGSERTTGGFGAQVLDRMVSDLELGAGYCIDQSKSPAGRMT